ncbi:MAG: polyprenol monophosphomannose synthase [Flavobacteriaceae bacterium TMED121]|nr:MAG: polyprenol monophosphomannose synthase [Flavobacteriaceae bacterium TMED121]|tara:strand:+ start:6274 stop:6996 length:723 start_codon:yes stop_codon:yes gene_type:complete
MEKALVIIPTYNEAENIKKVIEASIREKTFDVLVVDDSSPDGTSSIVKEVIKSYPKKIFLEVRKNKDGLGRAYVHGFKWAIKKKYDYIFEMDADFSHNPSELITMLEYLKKGNDMVIGSRYIKGINVVNWPLGRILLSYLASVYVRVITSMPIKDPTAGFVGYKREVLEAIALDKVKFVGYAFQVEMKYKTWRKKFSYIEHPIIFTNRTLGFSKMDGRIIWEGLLGVLILRINDIFGLNK